MTFAAAMNTNPTPDLCSGFTLDPFGGKVAPVNSTMPLSGAAATMIAASP